MTDKCPKCGNTVLMHVGTKNPDNMTRHMCEMCKTIWTDWQERDLAAAVEAKESSDAAYARLMDTAAKYRDDRDALRAEVERLKQTSTLVAIQASDAYGFFGLQEANSDLRDQLVAMTTRAEQAEKDLAFVNEAVRVEREQYADLACKLERAEAEHNRLSARVANLEAGLRRLMLESRGFLSIADPQQHGNANINVLTLRIYEAAKLLEDAHE